jgi:single-strand DNA-binding protein
VGFPLSIVGNLTGDLELRYTQQGLPVANGTIAVNERKFNRQSNEWEDGEPQFVRISVWRELGEHAAASLSKGMRVMATGKLQMTEYEKKEGGTGASLEMTVDEIGASLRYATAVVTKSAPKAQGAPGQQAPQGYGQQAPQGYGPPPGYGQQAPAQQGWPAQQGPGQTVWPAQPGQNPGGWPGQQYPANPDEPF